MRILGSFFSIFCFYFLHPIDAKANADASGSGYRCAHQLNQGFEKRTSFFSEFDKLNSESGKCCPWPVVASAEARIIVIQFHFIGKPRFFKMVAAREFYIRTGLSPPHLLVSI